MVEQPHQRLHVALRLDRPSHHADGCEGLSIVHDEGRDDRVERPLAGSDPVRVAGLQREPRPAVLEADPRTGDDDARSETHVVGLDQRHHHAACVGGREIHGSRARRRPVLEILRVLAVDQPCAACEIGAIEHLFRRDFHGLRIADVAIDVGEGEFHRLDLEVLHLRGIDRVRLEIEGFEYPERHQGGDALAVRRNLEHGVIVVVEADRCDPIATMRREIVRRVRAAVRLRVGHHRLGQLAAIERLALGPGNLFERRRQPGRSEDLTDGRGSAPRQEVFGESRHRAQDRHGLGPLVGNHRAHRETVASVADCRSEQVRKRELAVTLGQRDPAGGRAGNRDRVPTRARHRVVVRETLRRPRGGRASRGVETRELAAVPDNGEQVAADPVAARLDDRQCNRGRQRGVDRVATGAQHGQPSLRRERLRGRDDIACKDRRAARCVGNVPVEAWTG